MDLPDIIISRNDFERLDALLADADFERFSKGASFLLEELTRAQIVDAQDVPSTVVTMGSTVQFRYEESGQVRVARLVYPGDTGLYEDSISALSPTGAALLGLSEGQSILYEMNDGHLSTVTVLKVLGPPSPNPLSRAAPPGTLEHAEL